MDLDASFAVEHPAAYSVFRGQPVDERPKADALHDAANRNAPGENVGWHGWPGHGCWSSIATADRSTW